MVFLQKTTKNTDEIVIFEKNFINLHSKTINQSIKYYYMKKSVTLLFLSFISIICSYAQIKESIVSPNGKIKVEVKGGEEITFSVEDENTPLLKDCRIQLSINNKSKHTINKINKTTKIIRKNISAPIYKFTSITDEYNQMVLVASDGINVEFRAYDTGVAYRFLNTKIKKDWIVNDEVAEYKFTKDATAYLSYSTNEKNPKAMAFQATYEVAPLSSSQDLEAFLPTTIDMTKQKITLFETDVEGYPGMFVKGSDSKLTAEFAHYPKSFDYYPWRVQKYVTATEDYIAKGKGVKSFPWRVFAITHDDKEMPTNTLAYQLASANRIEGDLSWIKPGKVAWDWWNNWGLSNVDFEAGINQDTYKYYIDFASANGIEYIVLDEGWYNPKSGDMLIVIPEINLPELVKYGKEKNVDIILWTVFNVLDSQLDEACERYSKMGIKGFKVDFMDRYDQEGVDMIYRIAKRCAQSKLMLDYHGIFAPQGITRTYPNVVNFEACFGMEEAKWTVREKGVENGKSYDRPSKDMPKYDVTFPYIRGMVGPVDFTPGGMRNATIADYQPMYYNPFTMGTRCHQLACYIIHESPLTMLADNPTIYMKEKECTDFICSLPDTYQDMKCIAGKLGESIVIARRQNNDWYVAGQKNWDEGTVSFDFSFLPKGTYEMTMFCDGKNANQNAMDYVVKKQTITVGSTAQTYSVKMASGGGFAAKIIKK